MTSPLQSVFETSIEAKDAALAELARENDMLRRHIAHQREELRQARWALDFNRRSRAAEHDHLLLLERELQSFGVAPRPVNYLP